MQPTYEETVAQVKEIVLDVLMDVDRDEITDNAMIKDDLGGDSLDLVDIAVRIERKYQIPFKLEELLKSQPDGEKLTPACLSEMILGQIKTTRIPVSAGA